MLGAAAVDAEVPEMLRDIAMDAQRAAQIIWRLPCALQEGAQRAAARRRRRGHEGGHRPGGKDLERRRVQLDVTLHPGAPRVLGDIVQLQQVILNLLIKAAEAMTDDSPRDLHVELRAWAFSRSPSGTVAARRRTTWRPSMRHRPTASCSTFVSARSADSICTIACALPASRSRPSSSRGTTTRPRANGRGSSVPRTKVR